MADYTSILADPYNPVRVKDNIITFPSWLTEKVYHRDEFPQKPNWSVEDHVIHLHASFYDAQIWYPWLEQSTIESRFIVLTDDEVEQLIYNQTLPDDKKDLVLANIKAEFRFVKSSKKSSHFRKKVKTYEQFIEEITHPQVAMSFKNGCKAIFMRRYVDNIQDEYRIYVYQGIIRYVEKYVAKTSCDQSQEIIEYVRKVIPFIKYQDYVLDVATLSNGSFTCIEINTPIYLFAGLQNVDYYFEKDKIHSTEEPIIRC